MTRSSVPEASLDRAMQEALAAVERLEQARGQAATAKAALPAPESAPEAALALLTAEFAAYRQRATQDQAQARLDAQAQLLRALLPPLDDLQRALMHLPPGDEPLTAGLRMVQRHLEAILAAQGLVPVPCLGAPFDPNQHEAVAQEASDQPAGSVLREVRRGYLLHARLLRPAQVVVAVGVREETPA